MAKQEDRIMNIHDLAKYLKLSTSTLYKLCAEGKVPGQKVGRHWRFHRMVIDQWIGLKPVVNRTDSATLPGEVLQGDIMGTMGTSASKGAEKGPGTSRAARNKNRGSRR